MPRSLLLFEPLLFLLAKLCVCGNRERLESELILATETADMAVLDKQLAEEQLQSLQDQRNELADRVEELTLEV